MTKIVKQMKGWKVLTQDRYSGGNSYMFEYSIRYPLNTDVYPPIEGSLLFFFKYKKDAREFVIERSNPVLIVPCIASNARKINTLCGYMPSVYDFWTNKSDMIDKGIRTMPAPKGTWGATSIRCLK